MDILFILHILLSFTLITIPFWQIDYLKFGVYIPLIISASWIIFNGCPLTKIQKNLNSNSFTKEIFKYFIPSVSTRSTENINTFILVLVTVIGFNRLYFANALNI